MEIPVYKRELAIKRANEIMKEDGNDPLTELIMAENEIEKQMKMEELENE